MDCDYYSDVGTHGYMRVALSYYEILCVPAKISDPPPADLHGVIFLSLTPLVPVPRRCSEAQMVCHQTSLVRPGLRPGGDTPSEKT